MSALSIQPTYPIFTEKDGLPLENGYIWLGTVNLNPIVNPIAAFFDAALTIPVVQPIRTLGGYPVYEGTPARIYVNSDYSIQVNNKNGSVVYSAPAATERYGNIINASGITFTPCGANAVPTTVGAKLCESVSLTDYVSLKDALATGQRVTVPCSTGTINILAADSPSILPALDRIDAECGLTLSLAAGVHTTIAGNIANVGQNQNITVEGATPVSTDLIAINSVSGSTGNYTVEIQVASSAGIVAGDYLKLDNVIPLMTFSGDNSVFRERIAPNELGNQLANLGNITAVAGGATASWAAVYVGVLSDYISPGDLLTVKGQTRVVNVVGGTTVSIFGTWDVDTVGSRAWYLSRPNSGTVNTKAAAPTGTIGTGGVPLQTITGVGSLFLTEVAINDLIQVGTVYATVTAIANNLSLTVSAGVTIANGSAYNIIKPSTTVQGVSTAFTPEANVGDVILADGGMSVVTVIGGTGIMTVSPEMKLPIGTPYSIITPGFAHEGTHEVVLVVGNIITVTNKWRGSYAPAINAISGGQVKAIKTILHNTGAGDGFFFSQNSAINWINNLVLKGDGVSTSSHGLALDGRTTEGPTQIGPVGMANAGDGFAVTGFGRGAFLGNGCVLQTRRSHYSGNQELGVWALEGSTVNLREVIVSGTNGKGVQINSNASLLFTSGHSIGNAGDGLSLEAGAAIYAEIPCFWQNGGIGMRFTGAAGIHVNEGITGINVDSGVISSASAVGEVSRVLSVGNGRENFEFIENSKMVANEIWATGGRATTGTGRGVFCVGSQVTMNGAALTNNGGGPGYFFGAACNVDAITSVITGVQNNGIVAFNLARVAVSNSRVEKFDIGFGGYFMLNGVTPTPAIALSIVARQMQVLQAINFGTVGAGSSVTSTITVPGAQTLDTVFVSISNSVTLMPDGLLLDAAVTAPNTVSVRAQNRTGGGIAANVSLRVTVIGYA
jgi:hypothetical protein